MYVSLYQKKLNNALKLYYFTEGYHPYFEIIAVLFHRFMIMWLASSNPFEKWYIISENQLVTLMMMLVNLKKNPNFSLCFSFV